MGALFEEKWVSLGMSSSQAPPIILSSLDGMTQTSGMYSSLRDVLLPHFRTEAMDLHIHAQKSMTPWAITMNLSFWKLFPSGICYVNEESEYTTIIYFPKDIIY